MFYVLAYIICYAIVALLYFFFSYKWKLFEQLSMIHEKCQDIGIYKLIYPIFLLIYFGSVIISIGSFLLPIYIVKAIESELWGEAFLIFILFIYLTLVAYSMLDRDSQ